MSKPFQERFRILLTEAHRKRRAAVAEPCTEDVHHEALLSKHYGSLPPVNLHGLSRMEFQGDISLGSGSLEVCARQHGQNSRSR